MSTFGWLALILLPILGGVIAWFGDVIGYRLGKSRRSLFGLRPRVTARLIGIAVGVALPLIGVGAALLGSPEARDALFHIDELRRQQTELTQQNQTLETRQQRTQQQARASEARALELRRFLGDTRRSLAEAQTRMAGANRELGRAQQEVRRASGNANRLQAVARSLQRLIGGLQSQLTALQAKLIARGKELADKGNELTARQAELTARQADIETLKTAFSDAIRLINSPVELETGHELVRTILETGDTEAITEQNLLKVLIKASEAAAGHGAETAPGSLAVRLIRPFPPGFKPGEELPNQADILRAFARDLQAAGKRTFVVGVRVARRMYKDEVAPVGVEIWALPYVRVFVENQVIYQVPMDGSQPRAEIFTQLWNLLKIIVRREAREAGLLPNAKTGEYGEVTPEQFLTALDEVTAQKGPVQVRVVAAADTYIADPLIIRIEVGKGGEAAGGKDSPGD